MGLFSRKKKEEEKPKSEKVAREEIAPPAGGPSTVKLPKGEDAYSYRVILNPIITEKGGLLEGYGKYFFKVARNANKIEIKKAIEKLYKVKVEKVHILSMPSKFRQVGEHKGRRPGFKKAIATLRKGERIEIAK